MSCTNCFSGCVSTTSDKCVKYTGASIPLLNITTGDPLEKVEEAIFTYLATVFSGEGIFPTIEPTYICDVVKQYFPCEECGDPDLVQILTAIIRAMCDIDSALAIERARIDKIEDTYSVDCLTVNPNAGTHDVLQAAITELCSAVEDINTLNNLYQTCITTNNINSYIQAYINSISSTNMMYANMVPYVIYPFYGTSSIMTGAFDTTGAGLGIWSKVYLCNGYNGRTPDLRGRSLIGVTTVCGGGAYDEAVDPGLGNPNYALGDKAGTNTVTLSSSQIAAHTHLATTTVTDPGHNTNIHFGVSTDNWTVEGESVAKPILEIEGSGTNGAAHSQEEATTSTKDKTDIGVAVSISPNVGGQSHPNVHPVYAVYYIMYIP